jgi:hypothetical protein
MSTENRTTLELLETNDAMVWAEEFIRLFGDRRDEIDEGLMVAWFANAMAAQVMASQREAGVSHG